MRCDKIRELLSPYIDGMTNEKEKQLLEQHLDSCAKCRQELEQLKLICNMVHGLKEVPPVPDGFAKDVHERLVVDDKFKVFGHKYAKIPKKQGWIAAGVAGLALAAGIFASSFLPAGNMIAGIKDRLNGPDKQPKVAIEDIIKNTQAQLGIKPEDSVVPGTPGVVATTDNINTNSSTGSAVVKPKHNGSSSISAPQPKTTAIVNRKIHVPDLSNSIQQIAQIASANQAEYSILPTGQTTMNTSPGPKVRTVALTVDNNNLDKVINELNSLGRASAPIYDKVALTEYNEAQNKIYEINIQIEQVQSQDDISAADRNKINELNQQLEQWTAKKAKLEPQVNQSTVNVYLVEDSGE